MTKLKELENEILELKGDITDLAMFLYLSAEKLELIHNQQFEPRSIDYLQLYGDYTRYKERAIKYMSSSLAKTFTR